MKPGKFQRGSITVFLSLILVVMISVILVCLESAHQAAGKADVAIAADAAADNVLSHYEKTLYENYGILAVSDRFDLKSLWKDSMEAYSTESEDGCHLCFQIISIDQSGTCNLITDNGKAFQAEVNEITVADSAGSGISNLKKQLKELVEDVKISGSLSTVTENGDVILVLEEQYKKINQKLENVRKTAEELEKYLKRYRDYLISADKTEEQAVNLYLEDIKKEDEKLISNLTDLRQSCNTYKRKAKYLSNQLSQIKEDMEDDSLSSENKKLLQEQYAAVEKLTAGSTYKEVDQVLEKTENAIEVLKSDYYPDKKQAENLVSSKDEAERFFKKPISVLEDLGNLAMKGDSQDTDHAEEHNAVNLLETVSSIMKYGPFGYIVGDTSDLSNRKIVMDDMPSSLDTEASEKSTDNLLNQIVKTTADVCSMNIYIGRYMNCYTDGGNCDFEYVLGDKTTDLENLKEVVNQLVLMRSALNAVYLLKDSDKYMTAEEAAAAIALATGTPEFAKVLTYMIIGAWAYAEAVCDVRTLVQGGKVPLMKSDSTWKLSLDGAEKAVVDGNKTKSGKKGLEYKTYLKLLLFFHKRTRNMFRTLDMIQWNVRQTDDGFRISQCVYETTFTTKVRIDPIYYSGLSGVLGKKAIFQYSHEEVMNYQSVS